MSLAASFTVMTAFAEPARAHVALLFTNPTADGSVPASPAALTLTFDSTVGLPVDPVVLTDEGGARVPLSRPAVRGSTLTVPVAQFLRPGGYTVTWHVTSNDGDVMTGRYRFAVGPQPSGSTLAAEGYVSPPVAVGLWPTVVLRWGLFAALAVALGGMAGRRLARPHVARAPRAVPEVWVRPAAVAGAVAATGLALIAAGGGSVLDGVVHPLRALDGRPGLVAVVEVAGFAVAALASRRRPRVTVSALLLVVLAEAMRGHPREAAEGWGALLIAVHLLAAALWLGALVQVLRTALAWRDRPHEVWRLVGGYARWAAWLFGAVVASGAVAGLLVSPLGAVFTTTYGRTLLVKLALVAAAAGLAVTARLRLRRGVPSGSAVAARAESGVLAAVLAVSALLVSLPPPLDAARPLPFPPPPSGPVVPLGALAGPVSISATASAGQLVIHLFVPGADDQAGAPADAPVKVAGPAQAEPRYELAAALADPAGNGVQLRPRRCGTGCFVAPAAWKDGVSQLTLRTSVSGTALGTVGGSVALPVAWPPRPDAVGLPRAWDAMLEAERFTLYEQVTSNTTTGPGALKKIAMDGKRFLQSEPYRANAPVVLRESPGTITVALPAERIHARLTVDGRGRILREVLTAPRYLITRTFVYPGQGRKP